MLVSPGVDVFLERYAAGVGQCVSLRVSADMVTPVAAMKRLKSVSPYHFLLESVQDGERRGRYSVIGLDPDVAFRIDGKQAYINRQFATDRSAFEGLEGDPFVQLQSLIEAVQLPASPDLPEVAAGLFGYLTYDVVRLVEVLPDANDRVIDIPDALFVRPTVVVVFDSVQDTMQLVTPVFPTSEETAEAAYNRVLERMEGLVALLETPGETSGLQSVDDVVFASNTTQEEYHAMVEKAKDYIVAGDVFQVVPSQRFSGRFSASPFALYRSLRHLNPSPYLFYMAMDDFALVGSSPEILVRVDADRTITSRPIAGTRKRGETVEEDMQLKEELLADEKDLAEHLMLLDLGRNDVGRVADVGSVSVGEQFIIEYYSHVMHIVSEVTGRLREDCTVVDALKACFPVGTVSGAPKIRAMEIIDELESEQRSFYAGGVGYFSAFGTMDICIALRTGLVKDGMLYIQAGGGVVADSDPEAEYQESCNKAKALMKAAEGVGRF